MSPLHVVCVACAHLIPTEAGRRPQIPWDWVSEDCEPCGCWDSKPRSSGRTAASNSNRWTFSLTPKVSIYSSVTLATFRCLTPVWPVWTPLPSERCGRPCSSQFLSSPKASFYSSVEVLSTMQMPQERSGCPLLSSLCCHCAQLSVCIFPSLEAAHGVLHRFTDCRRWREKSWTELVAVAVKKGLFLLGRCGALLSSESHLKLEHAPLHAPGAGVALWCHISKPTTLMLNRLKQIFFSHFLLSSKYLNILHMYVGQEGREMYRTRNTTCNPWT